MALRTWARLLGATLGAAALAGASQLGVAYGFGILRFTRVLDVPTRDQWTAQLAWVAWLAMMAAVFGGLAGGRLLERWREPVTVSTNIALSLAAGLGAALVVPLTMQPARTAQVAGVNPVFVIGLCAGLGALVGVFAAYAAVTQRVARWSLCIFGLIIWVVAIVAILAVVPLLPAVRLGVFDVGLAPPVTQRTALFTMPALALLVGAALGWAARGRGMPTLTIALAGLPGPALLTLAYLIAGPGWGDERYQVVPYWAAMTATGAGVLGSVLAALLKKPEEPEGTGDNATDDEQKTDTTGLPSSTATASTPPPTSRTLDPYASDQADPYASDRSHPYASDPYASDRPDQLDLDPYAADRPNLGPYSSDRPPNRPSPDRPDNFGLGAAPPSGPRSRVADALGSRPAERHQPAPAERSTPARPTRPAYPSNTEYPQPEPEPFDGFAPASSRRGDPSRPHDAAELAPGPAIAPDEIQDPPAARPAGGRLGRVRNPFSRTRSRPHQDDPQLPDPRPEFRSAHPEPAAPRTWPGRNELPNDRPLDRAPLVTEPDAVSAPLPQPGPIKAPPTATPEPDRRRGKKKGRDDDYVDWVSGLGS